MIRMQPFLRRKLEPPPGLPYVYQRNYNDQRPCRHPIKDTPSQPSEWRSRRNTAAKTSTVTSSVLNDNVDLTGTCNDMVYSFISWYRVGVVLSSARELQRNSQAF